jgi:hypothetical protein
MAETTEQKGAVANPPGESKAATSEGSKPTEPQTGQVDLAARYKINKLGDEVLGDELIKGYNRGRMFDKTQSELHKTQSDLEKISTAYKQVSNELERIKQEQMVREQLSRLMPQRSNDQEDELAYQEEEATKPIDQDDIVRRISNVATKPVEQIINKLGLSQSDEIPDIDTLIESKLEQKEAQLKRKSEQENWIRQAREEDSKMLASNYGSVLNPAEIKSILDMLDVGVTLQRRAEVTITDPEQSEQAVEDYARSRDLLIGAAEKIADAKIKAEKKAREDEIRAQLSSGRYPGLEPLTNEPKQPIFDDKKYLDARKKAVERAAKEQEAKLMAMRQIGGKA